MNDPKNDSNEENKLLNQKRKPQFSLEEILNIYCKQHNIEDNEIPEKIKTIYYNNPEQNILINYDKDNGDEFPLSSHILKKNKIKHINIEEKEKEKVEEVGEEKKEHKILINNEENKEPELKEKDEDTLIECFICGWKFIKELSIQEKNTHINLCLEGKGEENKKELISTYKELENLKNQRDNDDDEVKEKEEDKNNNINREINNDKKKEENEDKEDKEDNEDKD